MTDQRELDRLLGAFFADGTDELADRVIDAALDQIDHTRQRRAMRMPRRFQTMPMLTRVAAAAVIGVLAVGGTLFLLKPGQPSVVGAQVTRPPRRTRPRPDPAPDADPDADSDPDANPRQPDRPDGRRAPDPHGHGRSPTAASSLPAASTPTTTALASAVIYDPATDTFSPTGSMADRSRPVTPPPCSPTVAS